MACSWCSGLRRNHHQCRQVLELAAVGTSDSSNRPASFAASEVLHIEEPKEYPNDGVLWPLGVRIDRRDARTGCTDRRHQHRKSFTWRDHLRPASQTRSTPSSSRCSLAHCRHLSGGVWEGGCYRSRLGLSNMCRAKVRWIGPQRGAALALLRARAECRAGFKGGGQTCSRAGSTSGRIIGQFELGDGPSAMLLPASRQEISRTRPTGQTKNPGSFGGVAIDPRAGGHSNHQPRPVAATIGSTLRIGSVLGARSSVSDPGARRAVRSPRSDQRCRPGACQRVIAHTQWVG